MFLTDVRSDKEREIEVEGNVGITFVDLKANVYLSITASATLRRNHSKAAEIWKPTDAVWWDGPDDPNVCILQLTPRTAELWDGQPSKVVTAFEFVKARLTGRKPNLGETRKVTLGLRRRGSALTTF